MNDGVKNDEKTNFSHLQCERILQWWLQELYILR